MLYYNTLFDENAACHIALGQYYKDCLSDTEDALNDDIAARGGNASLTHVDWMIGGSDTNADGLTSSGDCITVFRNGDWAE